MRTFCILHQTKALQDALVNGEVRKIRVLIALRTLNHAHITYLPRWNGF